MQSLSNCGFDGKIYPVGPNGGEISGMKIYPGVKDIPDDVDYVIAAIPARYSLQLIADCASKGVKAIHFFAAGFGEIEDEKGKRLEADIVKAAHQGDIRIIGPNCLGLYCPETGLSFGLDFPNESGPVGLLAQSGGWGVYCVREAVTRGIHFSKVISYGNAADLNETDFLEYLTHDTETKIIDAYIEGVKDGPRFIKVLKEAAIAKPVIIFKGGVTEIGTRSAASHTSAIAGSSRIWQSLLQQAGAIQANSVEEVVDVDLLLLHPSAPQGRNVAVIGMGGGAAVKGGDDCLSAGLRVPILPLHIRQRLKDMYGTEAGYSFGNPVDIIPSKTSWMLADAVKVIADCDQIDLLIVHVVFDSWAMVSRRDATEAYVDGILSLNGLVDKPVAIVLHLCATDEAKRLASEAHARLSKAGFPVYPSIRRAARAMSKFIQYHEWRQKGFNTDEL